MVSLTVPSLNHGRASTSSPSAPPIRRLVRFAGIGGAATAVQLGLFTALLLVIPQTGANLISWTVSTLIANSAHRSLTFGVHGSATAQRDFLVSAGFSLLSLGVSVAALAVLSTDGPVVSILVLIGVNTVIGLARYAGLSWWFSPHPV